MRCFLPMAVAACAVLGPGSGAADQIVASYYVELGPQDFYNSRGTRLTDGAAIFQQDRANVHRFGIRHGGDDSDPVFGDSAMRARIPALLRGTDPAFLNGIARLNPATAARPGYAEYVVFICGQNGQITRLAIDFADGDGYIGCD